MPHPRLVASCLLIAAFATMASSGRRARADAEKTASPPPAIEALPGVTPVVSGLPFFFIRGAPPGNAGYFIDGVPPSSCGCERSPSSCEPPHAAIEATKTRVTERWNIVTSKPCRMTRTGWPYLDCSDAPKTVAVAIRKDPAYKGGKPKEMVLMPGDLSLDERLHLGRDHH